MFGSLLWAGTVPAIRTMALSDTRTSSLTISILVLISFLIPGHEASCVFSLLDERTFSRNIHSYLNVDSRTRILDYKLRFHNLSADTDIEKVYAEGWPKAFEPDRWFRTQGVGITNVLLVRQVYYGLIWPFLDLGVKSMVVDINVHPSDCFRNLTAVALKESIRDYLLNDFDVDPSTADEPYKKSKDVSVCHQHIEDVDGWGRLQYTCCRKDEDLNRLFCDEIHNDGWSWCLTAAILIVTLVLFLYLPALIPKGYTILSYRFTPPTKLTFNFVLSSDPDAFENVSTAQVLKAQDWRKLKTFRNLVAKLQPDVTYTATIGKVYFSIGMDKLVGEGESPVSLTRSFFDAFVRCKIRHTDPLEDCCKTPFCGLFCCLGCPKWHSWMRALRTVVVMVVISLPAWPFMYAMSADDLMYQRLAEAIESRNLARINYFYPGSIAGKVFVGIITFMYLLNIVIVVVDGATDVSIGHLYADVLGVIDERGSLQERVVRTESRIRQGCNIVRRFGILFLPLWVIVAILFPVYLLLKFIFNSPTISILKEAVRKITRRYKNVSQGIDDEERFIECCEMHWFFLTIVFVIVVLSIGINFILYVAAMIIIKVLVDSALVYKVLPVILLLLLYVRDSFVRVSVKYQNFHATVVGTIKNKEEERIKKQSLLSWADQENVIFKVKPEPILKDEDSDGSDSKKDRKKKKKKTGYAVLNRDFDPEAIVPARKRMFLLKNGSLRMHLKQLLLFFNKTDLLYSSKKFIFYCSTIDCGGAPGILEENYITAVLDFLKIGAFLFFVFLIVMAYGNAYYISPTNHLFITLVSGLVPLVLRNVFLKRDAVSNVNTNDYRFEAQLREKMESFSQSFDVEDIEITETDAKASDYATPLKTEKGPNWHSGRISIPRINLDIIDLVLDVSEEYPDLGHQGGIYVSRNSDFRPPNFKVGVVSNDAADIPREIKPDGTMDSANYFTDSPLWTSATNEDVDELDPTEGPKDEVEEEVETEGENSRRHPRRWRRRYDNDRHRNELERAHNAYTNEVVAGTDAILVASMLHTVLSNEPETRENPENDSERPRRENSRTRRTGDVNIAHVMTADNDDVNYDTNGGEEMEEEEN